MERSRFQTETVIKPQKNFYDYLKEVRQCRGLLLTFARRDISLRYKYTIIGIGWAIINPLLITIALSIAFGRIKMMSTNNIPYPVSTFLAYIFWVYFSRSLSLINNVFLANRTLITKIYFPRIILPASSLAVGLVDFFLSLVVFLAIVFYYHLPIYPIGLFLILPCLLITVAAAFGLGLFFSFLNVRYNDAKEILPFLTTLLFFLTPVFYSVRLIPQEYHFLLFLNPMTGVIETMRISLLTNSTVNWAGLAVSLVSSLFWLSFGIYYFRKNENELNDTI